MFSLGVSCIFIAHSMDIWGTGAVDAVEWGFLECGFDTMGEGRNSSAPSSQFVGIVWYLVSVFIETSWLI